MSDRPHPVVAGNSDRPTDNESTTDQRPADHDVLTLEETAERLGISINAVRQRIKRGTLPAERTPAGWVVSLATDHTAHAGQGRRPTDQPRGASRPATGRPIDPSAIGPLADLIADLSRENRDLAASTGHWQARAMIAEEQLKAIAAGPITQNAGDVEDAAQDANTGPLRGDQGEVASDPRQSAWRRWWRRMTGSG